MPAVLVHAIGRALALCCRALAWRHGAAEYLRLYDQALSDIAR